MMLLSRESNSPGIIKAKTCRGEHHKPDFLLGFQFSFTNQLFLQDTGSTNDHSMCSTRHTTETRKCKITSASFLLFMLLPNRNSFCFISQCTIFTTCYLPTLGFTLSLFLLLLLSINGRLTHNQGVAERTNPNY